jgi:tRNA dimethylallyltransferase
LSAGAASAPALLVLVGPTGSGKSELAVLLAERLGGEIVGCDALQVYRGLDAATAKPTAEERQRVPHHLVDQVDPRVDFSLADYVRAADRAIIEIAGRGRVPLIVGGTGMYLRGLLRGVLPAPPRNAEFRARLRSIARRGGGSRLRRWLERIDPASAGRIHPGDLQRTIRALELATAQGDSWSERLQAEGTWAAAQERYPALKLALSPDAEESGRRLDERVDRFFDAGLVREVRRLLQEGVPPTANAFKAIGYREVLQAIQAGEDPDSVRAEVKRKTRRYAKRQRTWFRGEPGLVLLPAAGDRRAVVEQAEERWRRFVEATERRGGRA